MSDNNEEGFVSTIANALQLENSEVMEKIEGVSIEQLNNLINAVTNNDMEEVKEIFGSLGDDDGLHPLLSRGDDENSEPADTTGDNASSDITDNSNNILDDDIQEDVDTDEFNPSFGDTVDLKGEQGSVKVARGPNGLVGVQVNGVLKMAKRSDLKPYTESIMSNDQLNGLNRMRLLAGIASIESGEPLQIDRVQTIDVPNAPETQGLKYVTATDLGFEPEDPMLAGIKSAFETIKSNLPNIKQSDVKLVRKMVGDINNTLYEGKKPTNLLRTLEEKRSTGPSRAMIAERVSEMGYTKQNARRMVETYYGGADTNDNHYSTLAEKQVVKKAIESFKNR